MTVNALYLALIAMGVSIFDIDGKKCCNVDCTTAIAVGRTQLTLQDNYEGFLTFKVGQVVKIFALQEVEGIEIWDAEIEKDYGYIVPAAVKIRKTLCTPVEVNDGKEFKSELEKETPKVKTDPPVKKDKSKKSNRYKQEKQNSASYTPIEVKPAAKLKIKSPKKEDLPIKNNKHKEKSATSRSLKKQNVKMVAKSKNNSPKKEDMLIKSKKKKEKKEKSATSSSFKTKNVKNVAKLNIFTSELIFKKKEDKWYTIALSPLHSAYIKVLELVKVYVDVMNINSSLDIILDYAFNNSNQVIIITLVCWIILSSLIFRKQIKRKQYEVGLNVEQSAILSFQNIGFGDKIIMLEAVIEKLRTRIGRLTQEKEQAEQTVILSKDAERIYVNDLTNPRTTMQQLENQLATIKKENDRLNIEKRYCIDTINLKTLDIQALEATRDQLEDDRYRLQVQQNKHDQQLMQMSKDYKTAENLVQQLKDNLHMKTTDNEKKDSTISDLNAELKTLQNCMIEFLGMENILMMCPNHDDVPAESHIERKEQLNRIEDMLKTTKVQRQLSEAEQKCDEFKSLLQTTVSQLKVANDKNEFLENKLEKVENELDMSKKHLMQEKARSEVIEEFYKDTLHTTSGVHDCSLVKATPVFDIDAHRECQALKDQVQILESDMRSMELSYLAKLNCELKQSIDTNIALQTAEEKLRLSQHDITECHKRLAQLEMPNYPVYPYYRPRQVYTFYPPTLPLYSMAPPQGVVGFGQQIARSLPVSPFTCTSVATSQHVPTIPDKAIVPPPHSDETSNKSRSCVPPSGTARPALTITIPQSQLPPHIETPRPQTQSFPDHKPSPSTASNQLPASTPAAIKSKRLSRQPSHLHSHNKASPWRQHPKMPPLSPILEEDEDENETGPFGLSQ